MQQLLKTNKKYIWLIALLALGLVFALIKDISKIALMEQVITYYWIVVVSVIVMWLSFCYKDVSRINRLSFGAGYFIRLAIFVINYWVVNIYTIVWGPAGDAVLYKECSLANYYGYNQGYPVELQFVYDLAYTKVLGKSYYIIGGNEFSGTFLNIAIFTLMSWGILIFSIRVSKELDYRLFALLQFMPVTIWLNTTLLRESILTLCILASLVCFYLFYTEHRGILFWVGALFTSALSFCLHSGNIVICIVYVAFGMLYYVRKYGKKLILPMVLALLVACFILFQSDTFRAYFSTYINMERVYSALGLAEETSQANTAYLQDFPINNVFLFILYGVLKYIYFWFSPMLWDLTGLSYAFIMIVDALPYIIMWFVCLKNKGYKPFWYLLILQSALYAMGTSAAGTAMRHRNIFVPIFLVMYIISQRGVGEDSLAGDHTVIDCR